MVIHLSASAPVNVFRLDEFTTTTRTGVIWTTADLP